MINIVLDDERKRSCKYMMNWKIYRKGVEALA
jgi:hypothetical protein